MYKKSCIIGALFIFTGCGSFSLEPLVVDQRTTPIKVAEIIGTVYWNGGIAQQAKIKGADFQDWTEFNGTNPYCHPTRLVHFDTNIATIPCRGTVNLTIQDQPTMDGWVKVQLLTISSSDYPISVGMQGCVRPACSSQVGGQFNYQAPPVVDATPLIEDVLAHLFHNGFGSNLEVTFTSVPQVPFDPFSQDSDTYCDSHSSELLMVEVTVCEGTKPWVPTGGL